MSPAGPKSTSILGLDNDAATDVAAASDVDPPIGHLLPLALAAHLSRCRRGRPVVLR